MSLVLSSSRESIQTSSCCFAATIEQSTDMALCFRESTCMVEASSQNRVDSACVAPLLKIETSWQMINFGDTGQSRSRPKCFDI